MIKENHHISISDLFVIAICIAVILSCYVLNTDENTSAFIQFMTDHFGRTNKWSGTYGPDWFVTMADEISALGSRTIVLMEIIFFTSYFYIIRYKDKLREFLVTAFGGLVVLLFLKVIFSDNYSQTSLLPTDGLIFPSGHAMMSIIMYYKIFNLIFPIGFKNSGSIFIYMSVILLALFVGGSRLIVGAHTPMEVMAGLAGGVLWTFVNEKYFS